MERDPSTADLIDTVTLAESDELFPAYTLDDAVEALRTSLPGFWWRGGTCALSSEAIIAPDHNCPIHGERLKRDFPPSVEHWNAGVEVELRPGSDEALTRALLAAVCRVKLLQRGFDVEKLADAHTKKDQP